MKIICIGRNYSEHAKEMDSPLPSSPIFFLKPDTSILKTATFYYPKFTKLLHYECELVIKIDKVGKNIQKKFAKSYYSEFTLGIDFTARDIQNECKKLGLPWEKAKGFDQSAPLSTHWMKIKDYPESIDFTLKKNNTVVQSGESRNMIFSFDEIICYLSSFITLKKGDLIFTGTPAGVGEVQIGDKLSAFISEENVLNLNIK
jgi:2-keto-4-pentenoate hydratase/2-oxohepta-3-ene-1,7-dioic acid hydratase in catechol pathway